MLPLFNKVIYTRFDIFHFGTNFIELNNLKRYQWNQSIQGKCLTVILYFMLLHKCCVWFMTRSAFTKGFKVVTIITYCLVKCFTIWTLRAFYIFSIYFFPSNILTSWNVFIKLSIIICCRSFIFIFLFDHNFLWYFFPWTFNFVNFINII